MRNDEVLERLQNLIGYMPQQKELIVATGIKQSNISTKKFRNSNWSDEEIEKLNVAYNVDIYKNISHNITDNCIEIDYIHLNPSCGYGTAILDEPEVTPIMLGKKMIETVLKVTDEKNLKIFKASGDSMTDTIDDGNILLVDIGRLDYQNGGVFLLQKNNDWFIKRLRLKMSGELEVISDNPKYSTETFSPNQDVDIRIRGRIIKNLSKGL